MYCSVFSVFRLVVGFQNDARTSLAYSNQRVILYHWAIGHQQTLAIELIRPVLCHDEGPQRARLCCIYGLMFCTIASDIA